MGCCWSRRSYEEIPEKPKKRILLVGPKSIGKTAFLCKKTGISIHEIQPTVGIDFYKWEQNDITYMVWDSSGSPRFYPILEKCIEKIHEIWVAVSDNHTKEEQMIIFQEWFLRLGSPKHKPIKILLLPSGTFLQHNQFN